MNTPMRPAIDDGRALGSRPTLRHGRIVLTLIGALCAASATETVAPGPNWRSGVLDSVADLTFTPVYNADQVISGNTYNVDSAGLAHSVGRSPGGGVYRFEVHQGEGRPGKDTRDRSELSGSGRHYPRGTDIWVSYAFQVETYGDALVDEWVNIGQFHGGVGGSPVLTCQLKSDHVIEFWTRTGTTSSFTTTTRFSKTDFVRGRWYSVVQHFRAGIAHDGAAEVWLDGAKVVDANGIDIGYIDSGYNYWKFGIYRRPSPAVTAVRFANMEEGGAALVDRIAHPLAIEGQAAGDQQPPAAVQELAVTATTSTSASLGWAASTDDVGVTAYEIVRDGATIATTANTTFVDASLSPSTAYAYVVLALDAAGHRSAPSATVTAQTGAAPDTQPPTAPGMPSVIATTASSVSFVWAAATDDRGVTAYDVQRDGAHVATVSGTSYTDAVLAADTAYSYQLVAIDDAGNRSPASAAATLRTSADGGDGDIIETSAVVATRKDDAEQRVSSGAMDLTSTDLQLMVDHGHAQVVGLRFANVQVPRGATIVDASIQFAVGKSGSAATSLRIRGQASDDAATFTRTAKDITARPVTAVAVAWAPPAWTSVGSTGPEARTPALTAIVQEIVSRPGWAAGHAVAIIIDGTGGRVAQARDRTAANPAKLTVRYRLAPVPRTNG